MTATPVSTLAAAAATAADTDQICAVCTHALSGHDRISLRFCDATQAQALTRTCICR